MSRRREEEGDVGPESGPGPNPATGAAPVHIHVTIIPAENPEIASRIIMSDAHPSTTVGEIRARIKETIPSHPALQRLRLIHAGSLLSDDNLTLERMVGADALKERRAVTIHLALRPPPEGTRISGAASRPLSLPSVMQQQQQLPENSELPVQGLPAQGSPPSVTPPNSGYTTRTASTPDTNPRDPNVEGTPARQPDNIPAGLSQEAVQRMRMHEQIMRQQIQATQAILREVTQAGMLGGMPIQTGQTTQPAIPLSEFQRHFNQARQARSVNAQAPAQAPMSQSQAGHSFPRQSQAGSSQTSQFHSNNVTRAPANAHPVPADVSFHPLQPATTTAQQTFAPQAAIPRFAPQQQPQVASRGFVINRAAPNGAAVSQTSISLADNNNPLSSNVVFTPQYESIYLLSSPRGHEAILLPPPVMVPVQTEPRLSADQVFRATHPIAPFSPTNRSSGLSNMVNQQDQQNQQNQRNQQNQQNPPQIPREVQPLRLQDLFAAIGPLIGPLWLFARLSFFAVILTWRRTWLQTFLIYFCATLIFLYQTGLLAPVRPLAEQIWTPIRQHIESLVRDLDVDHHPQQQPAVNGTEPDPQATAQRLLRQRHEQSFLRRAERSVALFVASFVPGVGEAQVAAREAAERRRREVRELVERERREQAERAAEANEETGNEQPANDYRMSGAIPDEEPGRITPENMASGREVRASEGAELKHRNVQPTVEDDTDSDSDA